MPVVFVQRGRRTRDRTPSRKAFYVSTDGQNQLPASDTRASSILKHRWKAYDYYYCHRPAAPACSWQAELVRAPGACIVVRL